MGRQSARIYYQGKDHKEIYFDGSYHRAIYIGDQLAWEKSEQFSFTIVGKVLTIQCNTICTISWGDDHTTTAAYPYEPIKHTYFAAKGRYVVTINMTPAEEGIGLFIMGRMQDAYGNDKEETTSIVAFNSDLPPDLISFRLQWHPHLTEIPISIFRDCAEKMITFKVELSAFGNELAKIPDLHSFINLRDFKLSGCQHLEPISPDMFQGCRKLSSVSFDATQLSRIPGGLFDGLENLSIVQNCFAGTSPTAGLAPLLWHPDLYPNILSYQGCFTGCYKLSNYDSIPTGWK